MLADKVIAFAGQGCLAKDTSLHSLAANTSLVIQAAKSMTSFKLAAASEDSMVANGNDTIGYFCLHSQSIGELCQLKHVAKAYKGMCLMPVCYDVTASSVMRA